MTKSKLSFAEKEAERKAGLADALESGLLVAIRDAVDQFGQVTHNNGRYVHWHRDGQLLLYSSMQREAGPGSSVGAPNWINTWRVNVWLVPYDTDAATELQLRRLSTEHICGAAFQETRPGSGKVELVHYPHHFVARDAEPSWQAQLLSMGADAEQAAAAKAINANAGNAEFIETNLAAYERAVAK